MAKRDFTPARLEAFSDGVIAIIITIMVLELKVPHGDTSLYGLLNLWPIFISYALSYLMVAIYWLNHHHLFHYAKYVDNGVLWANITLLFFLSLVPFFTAYVGENYMTSFAAALYAGIMLVCAGAFSFLRMAISCQFVGNDELLAWNKSAKRKNRIAFMLYALGIPGAYIHPAVSFALIMIVAGMYFLPDAWLKKLN
jgi:uncharacterized membrane protein